MSTRGEENTDVIIEACRAILAALVNPEPEVKEALEGVVTALEKLKTLFFLKTNLAVPITNTCRKDAEELKGLAEKQDLAAFGEAFPRFQTNIEKLLKQSNMEGLIIT